MTGYGEPPRAAAEAVTLALYGEAVIYHVGTGEVHRLDQVGAIVWQLLDGQTPVDVLVAVLAAAFDIDPSVVRVGVDELLDRLQQAFLLAGPTAPSPRSQPRLLTNPPSP
jgi:hypothetical protein